MEKMTLPSKELLDMVQLLHSDNEKIVQLALSAQDGNPSDGDDFYSAEINFEVIHGYEGTDYGSVYSVTSHNNFDYDANDGMPDVEYVSVLISDLYDLCKKIKKDKVELVEVEYVTKNSNTMSAIPDINKVIQFTGYSTSDENNKTDYGTITVLGAE